MSHALCTLVFYVPESHVEAVKQALFAKGAGCVGDYDCCSWQTLGQGQFRPLEGAQPFLGETGRVETVKEYRVEMVCRADLLREAIAALRCAHPYETPAFSVIANVDAGNYA